jgi:hypothetical protein
VNPRERRECRCASRSGAGGPAFDQCQLGGNMGFGMEKINEIPSSMVCRFPETANRAARKAQGGYRAFDSILHIR